MICATGIDAAVSRAGWQPNAVMLCRPHRLALALQRRGRTIGRGGPDAANGANAQQL